MFKILITMFALLEFMFTGMIEGAVNNNRSTTLSESISWLEKESRHLIRTSKRTMKDGTSAFPPQSGAGYEAFWLRDYEYTLEGSIDAYSDKELTNACRLFVKSLRSDGAGVDCIKFDGTPIYMPGLGSMGKNPVADGSQFTVAVAWHTFQKTKDTTLLKEIIGPLVKTMNAVPLNPANGLVHIKTGAEYDRCPYGFTDTVRKQGDVLFCSLLYVQAGRQLSDLLNTVGRKNEAATWKQQSEGTASSIRKVFWDPQFGLFRAATAHCREHDIWGSAFAVFLGVTNTEESKTIATYFKNHYKELVQAGQIRHLPGNTYWEKDYARGRDRYQNGAYWATPTGWFVYTLNLVDPELADQAVIDMVHDFKKHGACEWIFGATHHLPNYLASASLPLAGIRAMLLHRNLYNKTTIEKKNAYLMAYFGPQEKLFYAYSHDARNWTALNRGKPVFDAKVRLRDPFIKRVKGKFHLVHTMGWDHPTIFHWESTDLIKWRGGPIDVVDKSRKRAWAPEFFYSESDDLFYVFWASIYNGHNTIHVVTTKDWTDITPKRSSVYFDIGIHDIDLTIVKFNGTYYGFHKPGDVGDKMGNRLSVSRTLDPAKNTFGDSGHGKIVFDGQSKPTEGPEVIRLTGQEKWYIYGDPFYKPMEAWETTDFIKFTKIQVTTPKGSKHCSMIPITESELNKLLEQYPNKKK